MPTTIYDASQVTKRKNDKIISNSFFTNMQENTIPSKPYLGINTASLVTAAKQGKMSNIQKCIDGGYMISEGCPCNAPVTESTPTPVPPHINRGLVEWATYIDGSGLDIGQSVTTDSINNIYVTGYYSSSLPVTLQDASGTGQTPSLVTLPVTSSTPIFIAKYNP
jgi:hypothetical protein